MNKYLPSSTDYLDVVADIPPNDTEPEEDARVFVSKKTGRGPLPNGWIEASEDGHFEPPYSGCVDVMCAYKLCRVEFKYWGMQTRIERFIHDIGKWLITLLNVSLTLNTRPTQMWQSVMIYMFSNPYCLHHCNEHREIR